MDKEILEVIIGKTESITGSGLECRCQLSKYKWFPYQ